jgi:hypothetical protein
MGSMETTLLYLTLALGLMGVTLSALVGIVQYKEYQREQKNLLRQKEKYRRAVCKYRLSKMLGFIGIRLDDYLSIIPHEAIRKHIINCKNCPNIPTCDRCLRDGEYVNDMNFCPNYQSLMAYSRIMPSVE